MFQKKLKAGQVPKIVDSWEVTLPNGTKGQATIIKKPKSIKSTKLKKRGLFGRLFS